MAQRELELVVDAALPVVEVGVADPARLHLHQGFARSWIRDLDGHDLHRLLHRPGDDGPNLLDITSPLGTSGRLRDHARRAAAPVHSHTRVLAVG